MSEQKLSETVPISEMDGVFWPDGWPEDKPGPEQIDVRELRLWLTDFAQRFEDLRQAYLYPTLIVAEDEMPGDPALKRENQKLRQRAEALKQHQSREWHRLYKDTHQAEPPTSFSLPSLESERNQLRQRVEELESTIIDLRDTWLHGEVYAWRDALMATFKLLKTDD